MVQSSCEVKSVCKLEPVEGVRFPDRLAMMMSPLNCLFGLLSRHQVFLVTKHV